jgi:integrase
MTDTCKLTGKSLKNCPNGDKHAFKIYAHVPGTKNERKTKKLDTRNLDEAIRQAIEFKNQIKENHNKKDLQAETPKETQSQTNKPQKMTQVMARYIGWLHNEGVPAHKIKTRSIEHIKDVERAFRVLAESLKSHHHDLSSLSIHDLNDHIVGEIFTYLEDKQFANRTFNKYFSYYTSFLKWYGEEYRQPIINWFEEVQRKKINPNPEAITQEEYKALLQKITPENGLKEYAKGVKPKRNMYRPWLRNGIRLALETGRRREEIINLAWANIQESEGVKIIKTEDFKVNHIQRRKSEEEKKFIYIPVTDSLWSLLQELDYEKYRNTENYILAPDLKNGRTRVMSDILSKGFTHYYDQLNTGRKLTFKSLRKAYITQLQIFMQGGDTKAITGHSDNQVIERNYIDKKEMAKAAQSFNVFSKEPERAEELKGLRDTSKSNQKEPNREV